MSTQQALNFLHQVSPFSSLNDKVLATIADAMDVVYFALGSQLEITQSQSEKQNGYLYFVIKGHVAEYDAEQQQRAVYGHNTFFGEATLLQKESFLRYEVIEEAILYRLPQSVFIALLEQPNIEGYFVDDILTKLNRLQSQRQAEASSDALMGIVSDAPWQNLVVVSAEQSIRDCVEQMHKQQTDASVIEQPDNEPGIVTSIDLLNALALNEHQLDDAVGPIANRPLVTVHQLDYLFNALLKMTKYRVNRLVVRSDEELIGVLHQKELMSVFANQSGLAVVKIQQAQTVADLRAVVDEIDRLVIHLNNRGVKTHYIAKLVNELHRKLIQKVFELLTIDRPEVQQGCLMVMGSEGRAEQVIRTDQDNAFILPDSVQKHPGLGVFMQQFSQALIDLGFPRCPGNIMVSNPEWCLTLSEFKQQLRDWLNHPTADTLMKVSILFDAEAILGDANLLAELKQTLFKWVAANQHFLPHFAKPVLMFDTPINFFGHWVKEKPSGQAQIDLKKTGIFPIVHGVRCLALKHGITKTNTHWRIKALMDMGVLDETFGFELGEVLNFMNTLRLEAMIVQLNCEKTPDNLIQVTQLSSLQQDLLKDGFKVVSRFKQRIDHQFKVSAVL
ncbi:nucleotidyltransferase [Hydrogenovibrio sp. SC-1]|uniref:DUF294 nucleotidyltransferase-like domain-containing protein n=1 Tax=Hydrogenovibrio sp. SC-1 TaxID=2065820 RepID=UPI000C7ACFC5|nr:DUF294 nucleotidyltransferase-like domain-containing protein [Hydrogenovibrio sp. SC-1]PLA73631.1 nucleotidyltransferase [Hydrogenovibrio sp. SC-1]